MNTIFALAVLAVITTVSDSSVIKTSPRANLNVGNIITGDKMLHRSYVYRTPIPNTIQYEDVIWRGNATNRITAIHAYEVGAPQYGSAYIFGGGIGRSNVTVRFTSSRGYGYYYLLDIWGR